MFLFFFFFFSSRRRHTRSTRDWSSDVCSSDLIIKEIGRVIERLAARGDMAILLVEQYFEFARDLAAAYVVMQRGEIVLRSEERRVGKSVDLGGRRIIKKKKSVTTNSKHSNDSD